MHHATDRIAHTTAFVTPVVEHWLEREIAQWVHPMKDQSDNPSHHERTLLPRSYISLPPFKTSNSAHTMRQEVITRTLGKHDQKYLGQHRNFKNLLYDFPVLTKWKKKNSTPLKKSIVQISKLFQDFNTCKNPKSF